MTKVANKIEAGGNLIFDRISIENFKSFVGEHEIDLDGVGLHFLRGKNKTEPRLGSNGSGKSSVWDSLCWCLYGRTPNGLRNNDVAPWHGDKKTQVTIFLSGKNSFEIVRTTHPNLLMINNEVVGQEQVDKLIGLSYPVFTNTVLLGQGQPLFFDMAPRDKIELMSDVLELDRWDKRSVKAREMVTELSMESQKWEGELLGVDGELNQFDELISRAKIHSGLWHDKQRLARADNDKMLRDWIKQLATAETNAGSSAVDLDGFFLKAKTIRETRDTLSEKLQVAQLNIHREESTIAEEFRQREALSKQLKGMGVSDDCPTCGRPLTGTNLAKHKLELKNKIEKIPLRKVSEKLLSVSHDLSKQYKGLGETLKEVEDELAGLHSVIEGQNRRRAELRANVSMAQKRDKEFDNEVNPHLEQVRMFQKKKVALTVRRQELVDGLGKRRRRIERTEYWVKGFHDVRLQVIDDVLQELELVTNSMLFDVGLVDWVVKYLAFRETKSGTVQHGITVSITSPNHSQPVKWESWSGGEGQRLRLIGALALSEVFLAHAGVKSNLEILDEPSHGLSVEGVHDLIDFLSSRATTLAKSIWFTDHHTVESAAFQSVVTVIKNESGSRFL